MTIGYLATSIGYYDQHRYMMCIGQASATDENVQSDENVSLSPGRKRPSIPSNKYQNVLHSE